MIVLFSYLFLNKKHFFQRLSYVPYTYTAYRGKARSVRVAEALGSVASRISAVIQEITPPQGYAVSSDISKS